MSHRLQTASVLTEKVPGALNRVSVAHRRGCVNEVLDASVEHRRNDVVGAGDVPDHVRERRVAQPIGHERWQPRRDVESDDSVATLEHSARDA